MPSPTSKLEYLRNFCESRRCCEGCPVKDPNGECFAELDGKLTKYDERAFDENLRIEGERKRREVREKGGKQE